MDITEGKDAAICFLRKNRVILLALLMGILLMLLPDKKETEVIVQEPKEAQEQALQEELEEILSLIQGAGDVRVLLTQAEGGETIYQTNESGSSDSLRRETVLVTNGAREESGLIRQVKPPKYQGAVILSQGAESAAVRLAIVEAVKSATGLAADRIAVLKMK